MDNRPSPYPVRMPPELRAKLEWLASHHNRKLSEEITHALENYANCESIESRLDRLEKNVEKIIELLTK